MLDASESLTVSNKFVFYDRLEEGTILFLLGRKLGMRSVFGPRNHKNIRCSILYALGPLWPGRRDLNPTTKLIYKAHIAILQK